MRVVKVKKQKPTFPSLWKVCSSNQRHKPACAWAEQRPQAGANVTSDNHFTGLIKCSHSDCHYTTALPF